jgi:hypothetical protein
VTTHRLDRLSGVGAIALGLRDLLRGGVLGRAQRLKLRQQLPAARVERRDRVDACPVVLSAARERGANGLALLADQPQVENR